MDLDLRRRHAAPTLGEPPYRAAQVWKWAAQGAPSYEEMTDLPRRLRDALTETVPFSTLTVEREARARTAPSRRCCARATAARSRRC